MNWVKSSFFVFSVVIISSCNQSKTDAEKTQEQLEVLRKEDSSKTVFGHTLLFTQKTKGKYTLWSYDTKAKKQIKQAVFDINKQITLDNLFFNKDLNAIYYKSGDSLMMKGFPIGQAELIAKIPRHISNFTQRIWFDHENNRLELATYCNPIYGKDSLLSILMAQTGSINSNYTVNTWYYEKSWKHERNIITDDNKCDAPGFSVLDYPEKGFHYYSLPLPNGIENIRDWIENRDSTIGYMNVNQKEAPLLFENLDSMNENGTVFIESRINGNYTFSFDLVGYVGKGSFAVFNKQNQSVEFMRNQDFQFDLIQIKSDGYEFLIYSSAKSDFFIDLGNIKNLFEFPNGSDNFRFIDLRGFNEN
ncbi:MAG: hypothetical protein JXQ87_06410 [Bacteroidia bacterium]